MNDKTIKNAEDTVNDLFDRAFACDAMSDDYVKYIKNAINLMTLISTQEQNKFTNELEIKKFELSKDIEQQKIDIEKEKIKLDKKKLNNDLSKNDIKLALEIAVPLGVQLLMMLIDQRNWMKRAAVICEFEKTGMFTTYSGKAIGQSLKINSPKLKI